MTISNQSTDDTNHPIDRTAVVRVLNLADVIELVNNRLNHGAFAAQQLVLNPHQVILHMRFGLAKKALIAGCFGKGISLIRSDMVDIKVLKVAIVSLMESDQDDHDFAKAEAELSLLLGKSIAEHLLVATEVQCLYKSRQYHRRVLLNW